jgi:hypothetical protein
MGDDFTWQWNRKNVARCHNGASHGIDIAEIRDGGVVSGGDGLDGVPDPYDVGEVYGGEVVVGGVEADAGEWDDEQLAGDEQRVGVLLGEAVGAAVLVGGGEPREDDVGDGGLVFHLTAPCLSTHLLASTVHTSTRSSHRWKAETKGYNFRFGITQFRCL